MVERDPRDLALAAPWHRSQHQGPHEYVLEHEAPVLYAVVEARIKAGEGHEEAFRGRVYQYLRLGVYEYWTLDGVLNRRLPRGT